LAQTKGQIWWGGALAVICLTLSAALLWLAQRDIPIGTAYAVWTGIGAAGTFLIGIWFFGDATSWLRYSGVFLIVAGVALLRLAD
jgi:quaternary ammonium compound-resistance protein SugE